jgi:hypothetical protein
LSAVSLPTTRPEVKELERATKPNAECKLRMPNFDRGGHSADSDFQIWHSAFGAAFGGIRRHLAFVIRHSAFGIRHSSFGIRRSVIRHSAFGIWHFGILAFGI